MKNTLTRIFTPVLFSCSLALMGCPVGVDYPLVAAEDAIEPPVSLPGTWTSKSKESQATKIAVTAEGDKKFNIRILEKDENYLGDEEYLAWIGTVKNHNFLILKSGGTTISYSLYHFEVKDKNTIEVKDATFKVKGKDAITSTAAFQEEIIGSMEHEDWLTSPAVWKRK